MDTLAFGYILPTTGRIRDFNPLETCAARRTTSKSPEDENLPGICFLFLFKNHKFLIFKGFLVSICIHELTDQQKFGIIHDETPFFFRGL